MVFLHVITPSSTYTQQVGRRAQLRAALLVQRQRAPLGVNEQAAAPRHLMLQLVHEGGADQAVAGYDLATRLVAAFSLPALLCNEANGRTQVGQHLL